MSLYVCILRTQRPDKCSHSQHWSKDPIAMLVWHTENHNFHILNIVFQYASMSLFFHYVSLSPCTLANFVEISQKISGDQFEKEHSLLDGKWWMLPRPYVLLFRDDYRRVFCNVYVWQSFWSKLVVSARYISSIRDGSFLQRPTLRNLYKMMPLQCRL